MKVTYSDPKLALLPKSSKGFIPAKKAPVYPASLSQRDVQAKAMNSAYENAKNTGKLGLGFGGTAKTSAMKALNSLKK